MNLDGLLWNYTVYTRTTKPVQTDDTKGKFPSLFFLLVLLVIVCVPLWWDLHTQLSHSDCANTGAPTATKKKPTYIFHFQIYTSLVDGIPFETGLFKMIRMICNVCVNIRSVLRTHSKATTAWAASEKRSYVRVSSESSNYLSKQSYDFTWNYFHWTANWGLIVNSQPLNVSWCKESSKEGD